MLAIANMGLAFILVTERVTWGFAGTRGQEKRGSPNTVLVVSAPFPLKHQVPNVRGRDPRPVLITRPI